MNPKMTLEDMAHYLGRSQAWVYAELQDRGLNLSLVDNLMYLQHSEVKSWLSLPFTSKVYVFQILKGGTGKTSLALEFSVRASLYGAKVLCIDLDQQGNLTQGFNQQAEDSPVMVDILAEGYDLFDSIVSVGDGIDLLPSRIENALLDEVLRLHKTPLERVYKDMFKKLKQYYDVIIVDCPPSLGQSVAAAALASDCVIAPVTPEKFALSGLRATCQSLEELEVAYNTRIPCHIVLNKFEQDNPRSTETWEWLSNHLDYEDKLLPYKVRLATDFPEAALKMISIFDEIHPRPIKDDLDKLTQFLLQIERGGSTRVRQSKQSDYVFI